MTPEVETSKIVVVASIVIAYIAILFIIEHIRALKIRITKAEEFFRMTGLTAGLLAILALGATYHTAFAIPGSMGFVYKHGAAWAAFGLWTIPVAALLMYTLGPRIAALAKRYGYITPPEILGDFYESKAVRVIYAIFWLIALVPYFVANISGPAILLSYGLGYAISYEIAVLIMVIIVFLYVLRLGFRAAYLTSIIQGAWMLIVTWIAAFWLVSFVGGFDKLYDIMVTKYPEHLTLPGPLGFMKPGMWFTWPIFGIAIGWALCPRSIAYWASGKDPEEIRKLSLRIPIYLWGIYVPVLIIGFSTLALYPNAPDPDMAFPTVMARYAPAILWGLLIAGSLAAGMSTLDADFVTLSGIATRDLYGLISKETQHEKQIRIGRIIILVLALIAAIFTLYKTQLIVMIVTMALSLVALTFPAVFFAVVPTGRFVATKAGVISGLFAGLIALLITYFPTYLGLPKTLTHALGLHAGFWGFITSLIVTIIVSLFTKKPSEEAIKKFHEFLDKELFSKK